MLKINPLEAYRKWLDCVHYLFIYSSRLTADHKKTLSDRPFKLIYTNDTTQVFCGKSQSGLDFSDCSFLSQFAFLDPWKKAELLYYTVSGIVLDRCWYSEHQCTSTCGCRLSNRTSLTLLPAERGLQRLTAPLITSHTWHDITEQPLFTATFWFLSLQLWHNLNGCNTDWLAEATACW